MKHIKLLKSLIIVAPVLALASPLIILSNTGCGNPEPEPETKYLADGSNWVGRTGGTLGFSTDDNNHTYTITGENNFTTNSDFTIPNAVVFEGEKYFVTAIGDYAFRNCTGITGVDLGGVTTIVSRAFYGCTNLAKVNLHGVTSIGDNAFLECPLEEIHVDSSNEIYKFVGTDSHNGFIQRQSDNATLSPVCGTSGGIACGNIVIPAGVTTIGDYAFYECAGVTTVDFTSVTTIGINAFYECIRMTGTNLRNVTTISTGVFYQCAGLTGVNLHNVTTFGTMSFYGCAGLFEADLRSATTLGLDWNMNCSNLSSVIIGSQTYDSSADNDGWGNVGPSTDCILYAPNSTVANAFKTNVILPAYADKWTYQEIQ